MLRYLLLVIFFGFIGSWFILRFDFEQSFVEGVVGQPADLFPGRGPRNTIDETLERLLFRSLFSYDRNGVINPDLAGNWAVSEDGKTYSITIVDAFWEDGEPVSAADVVFTFVRDPAFSDLTIEQEGEKTVQFLLKNPLASFFDILTRPIAPAHLQASNLDLRGNTSFSISKIVREGDSIRGIILKNSSSPAVKNLVFKFYENEKDLIDAANLGEVNALSAENFSNPSFFLNQTPLHDRYFALFFNLDGRNALLQNKEFRKASSQKIPSLSGAAVNGPVSGTWAQASLDFPRFNSSFIQKFQGKITITVPALGLLPEEAREIADLWQKELGITAEVKIVNPEVVEGILAKKDFEAIILGQEVARDPDRYNLWHSSQKTFPGQNISGYANPRADLALEGGRKSQDQEVRKTHYVNFQRLFIEDNPAILLYHPNLAYWVSRKFVGLSLEKIFFQEDRFWNFSSWRLGFESR
ncbi:hypothetical protein A2797_02085 [candidate division WWE3 bacterium RIFCSPHIGHO2_01_FULL_48_15]|uniref:Solute-binding protein family 5 domain-containing protein n=1 Tax=candidate division WWE3 bacterium RIFCSPHIGHO2_01_FULL_48_15 TaxID=1802619 RepID=A0A1F4VGA7_UNCKA|nr:MAG: hypothetical protein A2797_02085 [candidate division WWE3 bacterium RIFCSPHIGHO2_01_FULL_48_15]